MHLHFLTNAIFGQILRQSWLSKYSHTYILSQRSLPSLVLSPIPPNTEYPPYCMATLFISSMIRTAFPTPAPPKSPIFRPFRYGVRRSTTFQTPLLLLTAVQMKARGDELVRSEERRV